MYIVYLLSNLIYMLLHELEDNMGKYLARGWLLIGPTKRRDNTEPETRLNISPYCPTQGSAIDLLYDLAC